MPNDLTRLTMREQQALQALLDKREVYRTTGHPMAARVIGVAVRLVWQVFKWEHRQVDKEEEEPKP
jgi:hypothetical protein